MFAWGGVAHAPIKWPTIHALERLKSVFKGWWEYHETAVLGTFWILWAFVNKDALKIWPGEELSGLKNGSETTSESPKFLNFFWIAGQNFFSLQKKLYEGEDRACKI